MIAQPAGDLAGEGRRVQTGQRRRHSRCLGEDDRGDMRRAKGGTERQLREGTAGKEVLKRRIVVRQLMGDGTDDAALAIGIADRRDAGRPAQWALPPLGGHDQPRAVALACREGHAGAILPALDLRLGRRPQDNAATVVEAPIEGDAQAARLDHPAKGSGAEFPVVEMQEERRRRLTGLAVRDADLLDRTGLEGQRVP